LEKASCSDAPACDIWTMADPQDLDEILQQIRGQLRAELNGTPAPAKAPAKPPPKPDDLEERLRAIRGPVSGRAGLAGFAAHFLVPVLGIMALGVLLMALG
jgi:hypothetical protein